VDVEPGSTSTPHLDSADAQPYAELPLPWPGQGSPPGTCPVTPVRTIAAVRFTPGCRLGRRRSALPCAGRGAVNSASPALPPACLTPVTRGAVSATTAVTPRARRPLKTAVHPRVRQALRGRAGDFRRPRSGSATRRARSLTIPRLFHSALLTFARTAHAFSHQASRAFLTLHVASLPVTPLPSAAAFPRGFGVADGGARNPFRPLGFRPGFHTNTRCYRSGLAWRRAPRDDLPADGLSW